MRVHPALTTLVLIAVLTLSGCGNKGPLVMPDHKPPAEQAPVPPITHSEESRPDAADLPATGGSPVHAEPAAPRANAPRRRMIP
ncbi:MAG: lipoprotein [Rhodanobacteraceae bacterium]